MAFGLKDLLDALDRWGEWKSMRAAPAKLEALEKRVAELEEKLGNKWPPDVCRACGERGLRLRDVYGPDAKGMMREGWNCEKCKHHEVRVVRPK